MEYRRERGLEYHREKRVEYHREKRVEYRRERCRVQSSAREVFFYFSGWL